MKNNQRLKNKLTLALNKKQYIKLFVFSLVAFLLLGELGGVVNASERYFSPSECRYLDEEEDVVFVPDSAFDYDDIRFWLRMSGQKQCRNKDSNVYIVRAAKDFNVKTKKFKSDYGINTNKTIPVETIIKIKKGDLLMMFDDVDMKGTGKVKIVFGRDFFLINIKEDLLAKDNTGKLLKSTPVKTNRKKEVHLCVLDYFSDVIDPPDMVLVHIKPDISTKVIGQFRMKTVLPLSYETIKGTFKKDYVLPLNWDSLYDKSEPDEWFETFFKINLPEGGYGYIPIFGIGVAIDEI